MQLKSYLQKSISTGLGHSLGSALISLVFIPLIVRNIGVEKYGIWAILAIFTSALSFADLGLPKAMVYFIPKQKSREDITQVYSVGFFLNCFVISLVMVTGVLIYWSGINVWGNTESLANEFGRRLLLCGIFITCIALATSFYRAILEAFYKIYIVNLGFLLQTILTYTSVYILSFFTKHVEYFVFMTMAVYTFIFFLHVAVVGFKTPVALCPPQFARALEIIKYSLGIFSIGFLTSIMAPANRYLLVLFSGDMRVYGIFDIAFKIALAASRVLQSFAIPFFSFFAGLGKEKIGEIRRILSRCLVGLGGAYFFGLLLFLITGGYILDIFLQNDSIELYNASLILIAGVTLAAVGDPFSRAFLAIGDLRLSFNIKILQPTLNVLLILFLSGLSPLYRVSVACALAWGVTAMVYIVVFKIKYPGLEKRPATNGIAVDMR